MKFVILYTWITPFLMIWIHECDADVWHNNDSVSYYANARQQYNRTDAEAACRDRGCRLAMLKDADTHQFVYNILPSKQVPNGGVVYHIGLTRGSLQCGCDAGVSDTDCAACRRSWRWDDGTEMTTKRWRPTWPLAEPGRDCGIENSWREYDSVSCTTDKGFICQYVCESAGCKRSECSFNPSGVYVCQCEPGYTGQHCDTEINECETKPCLHGASCNDFINHFSCNCTPGYTGERCETDVNECSSAPCENGGTCIDLINSYDCNCTGEYTGTNCDTEFNACASIPCQNGGNCTRFGGTYTCICGKNFSGGNCETDINSLDVSTENNSKTKNETVIGLSVALAIITVIAITTSSALVIVCRRSRMLIKHSYKTSEPANDETNVKVAAEMAASEPVAIYEKVQSVSDDYQNAYQVLSA